MNKRLLIGTANVSKLPYLMGYFEGSEIECVSPATLGLARFDAPENAKTAEDNAVEKALAWYHAAHMPVLALDAGLVFLDLPDDDPDQPGVHVRRAPGHVMDDEEMLKYFMRVIHRHGGRLRCAWQDSYCLLKDEAHIHSYTFDRDMLRANSFDMVDVPCAARVPGWPLNSLSMDPYTGKYWLEMTEEDKRRSEEMAGAATAENHARLTRWLQETASRMLESE